MQRWQAVLITIACAALGTGCVTPITLAPGADQVRLTAKPGDVATCKPVGNIQLPRYRPDAIGIPDFESEFRNRVVGLGGNAGLVTSAYGPIEGIAYLCL
jgi:hypothetical protein